MSKLMTAAAACAALSLPYASGQSAGVQTTGSPMALATATCRGTAVTGTIRDSTLALIPGARVMLDGAPVATAGSDGRFRLPCVADGQHSLTITSDGFADRNLALKTPRSAAVDVTLVAGETVNVDVNAEDNPPATTNASGASATLSGTRLQALADDPDDLLRQLQQLAALSGGNPANTTIAVDGFQGSSALPPKASIAYIKVNPDQFSAEYREPPFDGGRVEDRPEFDFASGRPRQFDRRMLRIGRQRDDEVERGIFQLVEAFRLMRFQVDADLGHHADGERIDRGGPNADGIDIDMPAMKLAQQRCRHRRADRIQRAGKEHASGKTRHRLNPGYAERRAA